MAETRYVNGDPAEGADNLGACKNHHQRGHEPDCPWLTIQYGVDQLAKIGGGTLVLATYQYNENVVMKGKDYSGITIKGVPGKTTKPNDAQFCEVRPLVVAKDKSKVVFRIEGNLNEAVKNITLKDLNISNGAHGVFALYADSIKLIGCCIHDNISEDDGGGFQFTYCNEVVVKRCRVFYNEAKGLKPNSVNNTLLGGGGGGFFTKCTDVSVETSFFHGNEAKIAGGALRIDTCRDPSGVRILGNIFGDDPKQTLGPNATNTADYGGAISIDESDNVTIGEDKATANEFTRNEGRISGGAVVVEASTCEIGTNNFLNNKADQHGGAVYLNNGFDVSMEGARLTENEAKGGGGIYAEAPGIPGGNAMLPLPGKLTLRSCKLHKNKASSEPGGGLAVNFDVEVSIEQSVFTDNNANAGTGGGLFFDGTAPSGQRRKLEVSRTFFVHNVADDRGGGCHIKDGPVSIQPAEFKDNIATKGGALSFVGNKDPLVDCELLGCTFSTNHADEGGAAYIDDAVKGDIQRNKVTKNDGGFYFRGDKMRAMGFKNNAFKGNVSKGGVLEDIVSDSDSSVPRMSKAELERANQNGKIKPKAIVK